jgi:type III secretion protein U
MANDTSEEKTLAPSQKKLRDARKKGQVARSKDLNAGFALVGGVGALVLFSGGAVAAMEAMFQTAGDDAAGDFATGLSHIGRAMETAYMQAALPILVAVPVMVVLASMIMLRGIPFAVDPITPKFERINPAEGLKRLFGLKSVVELVKSLTKAVAIAAVFIVLLRGGVNALALVPSCGVGCVGGTLHGLAVPLLWAACVIFLIGGVADVGLQRWLFQRDQKMSVSEAKRERKDIDGDPILKQERRRLMAEARRAGTLGMKRATAAVRDSGRDGALVIGLRYVAGETPVPMVVCKGRDARAGSLVREANDLGVPVVDDSELVAALAGTAPGQFVPERTYRIAALALARAGRGG